MSAISRKNPEKPTQLLGDSPEEIRRRRRAIAAQAENRVGGSSSSSSSDYEPSGLAAEKPVGALCFLPKSLHRLASRAAEDRDLSSKRFFMESLLIGLEQQGVITKEQHADALALPVEYGWKGRNSDSSSSGSSDL